MSTHHRPDRTGKNQTPTQIPTQIPKSNQPRTGNPQSNSQTMSTHHRPDRTGKKQIPSQVPTQIPSQISTVKFPVKSTPHRLFQTNVDP